VKGSDHFGDLVIDGRIKLDIKHLIVHIANRKNAYIFEWQIAVIILVYLKDGGSTLNRTVDMYTILYAVRYQGGQNFWQALLWESHLALSLGTDIKEYQIAAIKWNPPDEAVYLQK
jgi:hypothetical protein